MMGNTPSFTLHVVQSFIRSLFTISEKYEKNFFCAMYSKIPASEKAFIFSSFQDIPDYRILTLSKANFSAIDTKFHKILRACGTHSSDARKSSTSPEIYSG